MPGDASERPIIVFDGVCVLCSRWVGFLIKRDPERHFRFSAMQSDAGRDLLEQAGLDPDDPSSFILVHGEKIHCQTDAIAEVLKALNNPWPTAASFMLLAPRSIRDFLYFRVARNRYHLFGQCDVCYAPTPEDRDRFIL